MDRFIEQSFRLFPIADHHGRLWSKIDCILVAWALGSPSADLFYSQVELSVPDIYLDNTVIDSVFRLERPSSLVHFPCTIQQADMRQDRAQTVVSMRQILLQPDGSPQFGDCIEVLEVLRRTPK